MNDNKFQAQIVKSEFTRQGFITTAFTGAVEVSLSNRKVSSMEVQYILDQEFDGIQFRTISTPIGILVII